MLSCYVLFILAGSRSSAPKSRNDMVCAHSAQLEDEEGTPVLSHRLGPGSGGLRPKTTHVYFLTVLGAGGPRSRCRHLRVTANVPSRLADGRPRVTPRGGGGPGRHSWGSPQRGTSPTTRAPPSSQAAPPRCLRIGVQGSARGFGVHTNIRPRHSV